MKIDLSIVIPTYNEQGSVSELISSIIKESEKNNFGNFEIIFVDDGSTDNTRRNIEKNLKKVKIFSKIISFRSNQGKSVALNEGFINARGEIVVTMDADLQDNPKEIKKFISKINEGFDLVSGWKYVRNDPLSKTLPSKIFNYITSKASGIKLHDFNCGFKAYTKDLVKELHLYGEHHQ